MFEIAPGSDALMVDVLKPVREQKIRKRGSSKGQRCDNSSAVDIGWLK